MGGIRLTGIVGVCFDVAHRPFISGQLLKHRQINQTVNAFGDVNGLRHVEVDGGRQQQVHLLTWHLEHGGNHIDGVFDALR